MFDERFIDEHYEFAEENMERLQEVSNICAGLTSDSDRLWKLTPIQSRETEIKSSSDGVLSENESMNVDYGPTQLLRDYDDDYDTENTAVEDTGSESRAISTKQTLMKLSELNEGDGISSEMLSLFVHSDELKGCLETETDLADMIVNDHNVIVLCNAIAELDQQLSVIWCVSFVECFILKRVAGRQNVPSRDFLPAVSNFTQKYPRSIVEGLMIPCLTNAEQCGRVEIEMVRHLFMENLMNEHQEMFLRMFFLHCFAWNEPVVVFLSACIESRAELFVGEILDNLLNRISDCCNHLNSNLSFSKFLNASIVKFRNRLDESQRTLLTVVVQRNTTFLKKGCLSKLQNLG